MSQYWQDFIDDIPWFLDPGDTPDVGAAQPPGSWTPASPEFDRLFPSLAKILRSAFVTPVRLRDKSYQLFSWPLDDGGSRAWLSPVPPERPPADIFPEHLILLQSFGGITERGNQPSWWLLNHNEALTEKEARWDGSFIRDYAWAFPDGIPIALGEFRSIAREANGNTTLCDRRSGEVVLFAPDHAFDYVVPYPGCPKYTLYHLTGAAVFADWVDTVAQQWSAAFGQVA